MNIFSVDVGYGNTKFCWERNGTVFTDLFPSIATISTGLDRGASVLSKRDLVVVESGENLYWVGKDSIDTLSAHDNRGRNLVANYIDSPQHTALLRGALTYFGEEDIDLLVTGLPVNHFARDNAKMAGLIKGVHHFPNGKLVSVKDVWVVPQPVGGFISYFLESEKMGSLDGTKSLTVDVGWYTVDWLVCRGLKMQEQRSGSIPGGMAMILEKLALLIEHDRHEAFNDLNIVEAGIRNGCLARIQGSDYDFSHLMPKLDAHMGNAIEAVMSSVGRLDDIDIIVMVGGGAGCYRHVARKMFGNREVIVPDGSVFANAKGFFMAASEWKRKKGA